MGKLTDEMIVEVINRNEMIGFVVAVVALVFLFISTIIVLCIGRTKAKTKNKKINIQIVIGLFMVILGIFILLICIKNVIIKEEWNLKIARITDKYTETESNS